MKAKLDLNYDGRVDMQGRGGNGNSNLQESHMHTPPFVIHKINMYSAAHLQCTDYTMRAVVTQNTVIKLFPHCLILCQVWDVTEIRNKSILSDTAHAECNFLFQCI